MSERYVLAYNPGIGEKPVPRWKIIATVRDELADLDDLDDSDFKVVSSRNLPADDQIYVFNAELISELSG